MFFISCLVLSVEPSSTKMASKSYLSRADFICSEGGLMFGSSLKTQITSESFFILILISEMVFIVAKVTNEND